MEHITPLIETNKKLVGVIGLPCSGKSTLIDIIRKEIACDLVVCGDIARELANTPELKEKMAASDLCSEEDLMRARIYKAIKESHYSIVIVDGLPRFGDQAIWINEVFRSLNPVIIQAIVGDPSTLYYRAKLRNRDETDRDKMLFAKRLGKAANNMTDAELILRKFNIPYYGLCSEFDKKEIVHLFKRFIA